LEVMILEVMILEVMMQERAVPRGGQIKVYKVCTVQIMRLLLEGVPTKRLEGAAQEAVRRV
jgi:hypothetical protein